MVFVTSNPRYWVLGPSGLGLASLRPGFEMVGVQRVWVSAEVGELKLGYGVNPIKKSPTAQLSLTQLFQVLTVRCQVLGPKTKFIGTRKEIFDT